VGKAVAVSVKSGASVAEIGVEVGIDVSVEIVWEVGGGEEQDIKRKTQKAESRNLDATCWDMDGILSYLLALSLRPYFGLTKQQNFPTCKIL
jgi:hypothetical protein